MTIHLFATPIARHPIYMQWTAGTLHSSRINIAHMYLDARCAGAHPIESINKRTNEIKFVHSVVIKGYMNRACVIGEHFHVFRVSTKNSFHWKTLNSIQKSVYFKQMVHGISS